MPQPNWSAVAPRFREARKAAGLSVFETSQRAGVRPHSIYAYETGETEPKTLTFLALCIVYGIDPRELVAA